jgi:spore coat protein CotH
VVDPTGKFAVATLAIDVAGGAEVASKETYVACSVTLNGNGSFDDYAGTGSIRGRGNSTWLWYDKKPYRIKLDAGAPLMGLAQNKDWVLLANYRDPTFLMNAYGFELAARMGLPYANHSRFVEVTLNGDYIGLYLLTEQVEQGANRVNVPDQGGVLLALDEDDGPLALPDATNNFASTVYELPVALKHPKEPTAEQLTAVQSEFATVESAIEAANYDALAEVLDIPSFIDFLLLQELVYNVELAAPRSMYMHKAPTGRFTMGPAWDFDGGFDFDWTELMTSHDYFAEQELILGSDPAGVAVPVDPDAPPPVSGFWVNMFKNARFVSEVKARWTVVRWSLLEPTWAVMENDVASISEAMGRNSTRWPIGKDFQTEVGRMKTWLDARVLVLDGVIAGYPSN